MGGPALLEGSGGERRDLPMTLLECGRLQYYCTEVFGLEPGLASGNIPGEQGRQNPQGWTCIWSQPQGVAGFALGGPGIE